MPTYPALPLSKDSELDPRDGRLEDVGADGIGLIRKTHADKADFNLVHPSLDATDCATLEAFYAANLTATFDFTWPLDGVTYQVRFGKKAKSARWTSPGRRTYRIRLVAAA